MKPITDNLADEVSEYCSGLDPCVMGAQAGDIITLPSGRYRVFHAERVTPKGGLPFYKPVSVVRI